MQDGIYFGLSETAYHKIERLSASGIKNLLVSVPTFWAKSWMNPDREDKETVANFDGSAYHCAVFEPDQFSIRYVTKPDWSTYGQDLLATDTAVKAELKAMGTAQTKTGENAGPRAERLRELGCTKPIKVLIEQEFEADLDGRAPLNAPLFRQIQIDMERIQQHPVIKDRLVGGKSEVTILWTCPDTGVKMKSRLDHMKPNLITDLKSFANAKDKPVDQAIIEQVQWYQYYLSMRVYQQAFAAAQQTGDNRLPIFSETNNPDRAQEEKDLIAQLREAQSYPSVFLFFQEKAGIPNLLMREILFRDLAPGVRQQSIGSKLDPKSENFDAAAYESSLSETVIARKADVEIARGKLLFNQGMEIYGPDEVWFPFEMEGTLGDEDFNQFWLDASVN